MIAAWPVVVRDRIVQAFKPGGSPVAEAPFRTLRRHAWVSQGVRVTLFRDRGLAGQMTFFSSLNVMAARLARRGNALAAARVARAAGDLEAGPEFAVLRSLLSELPDSEAEQAVSGLFPADGPAALTEALRAVASRTEQVRANDILLSSRGEISFSRPNRIGKHLVWSMRDTPTMRDWRPAPLRHVPGRRSVIPRLIDWYDRNAERLRLAFTRILSRT